MNHAPGMTEQQLIASGKSGWYSAPHGLWFFDGDTPQPLPDANLQPATAQTPEPEQPDSDTTKPTKKVKAHD